MFKKLSKIILVSVFLITSGYNPGEANERTRHQKLNTEAASVLESGTFELDVSYVYIDQIGKHSGAFNNSFGTTGQPRGKMTYHQAMLAITYGLMDKMDITARIGWADIQDREYPYADKHGNGITDLDVAIKYLFYRDERGLSLGYMVGLGIPVGKESKTGSLRIGRNTWSLDQRLLLTKDFDEQWTMNADVGYRLPFGRTRDYYAPEFGRRMDATRGTLHSNVAFGYTGLAFVQPVVETNYAHEWLSSNSDSDRLGFTVGAIVPIEKHRLRIGVRRDFWGRNATRAYTVSAGISLVF